MGTMAQKLQAILDSKADIAAAIQEKGGTVPTKLSGYGDAIRNIPAGTEELADVEFIDYDGRTVGRYTFAEASGLSELPTLPSRSGFINQGWNYTLSEVTSAAAAEAKITVGCTYITDDDVTKIYVDIPSGDYDMRLAFSQTSSSSIELNWGDGTTNVVGSTNQMTRHHTYAAASSYVITFTQCPGYENTPTLIFGGNIGGSGAVKNNQKIKKIELGKVVSVSTYMLNGCDNIDAISIPSGTTIGDYGLNSIINLKAFVIPKGQTTIPQYAFAYDTNLKKVSVPPSVTAIGSHAFYGCSQLETIHLNSVTQLGEYAFESCGNLREIDIPFVTTLPFHSFSNCSSLVDINANNITGVEGFALNGCGAIKSIGKNAITQFGRGSSNFAGCFSLGEIGELHIPANSSNQNTPTIGANCFYECKSLRTLKIVPADTTNALQIGANAFNNCEAYIYDFTACTQVPSLASTSSFGNPTKDKKILIPSNLATAWKGASNWSILPLLEDLEEYDTSRSYAVGEFCIHDTFYYRCKSATTGGNWNAGKWEECTGVLVAVDVNNQQTGE